MTSHRQIPKPAKWSVDYARAELLTLALFDQWTSLLRTRRLQRSNPKPTPQEAYELKETESQLELCTKLRAELAEIRAKLGE